jgi:growth factor receptor-binding protein 2
MEATALYDFSPSSASSDEMAFRGGAVLKVLVDDDKDWFKAELNGFEGYVPSNYIQYNRPSWYMSVSKSESVKLLTAKARTAFQHPDGAFVVRPSENQQGEKSLSVRIGNDVQHFRILRTGDKYFLWKDGPFFTSINQLIDHYHSASVSKTGNARLRDMNIPKAQVHYDFESRSNEELTIRRGEVITVLKMDDADWWEGKLERDGVTFEGLFPANYVSLIT